MVGWVAREQGDAITARIYLEQSLVLFRDIGSPIGIASGLNTLAEVAIMQEDAPWAIALVEHRASPSQNSAH
jgi:hypothetical protein